MRLFYHDLRIWLEVHGLLPTSRVARSAWYLLGLDVFLFVLQKLLGLFKVAFGQGLGGWVTFLSFVVGVLFIILIYRWLKVKLLWRLRNRLIVAYVFIGVTPVVLLVALVSGSLYLFAGQFATFIVTSGLNSELQSLQAANSAIGHEVAVGFEAGRSNDSSALVSLRRADKDWADREMYAWINGKLVLDSSAVAPSSPPVVPAYVKDSFRDIVRDHDKLFLRVAEVIPSRSGTLIVLSSEPLDQHLLLKLAENLGEVTLYASGLKLSRVDKPPGSVSVETNKPADSQLHGSLSVKKPEGDYVLDTGKAALVPTYTAGTVPAPARSLDRQVTFPTTVRVVNWETGDTSQPIAISVQTRLSKLYDRLFSSLGDIAPAAEFFLLFVAIVFGIIELFALVIGTRLSRTITKAVAQLYEATKHINRGDFSHRIPVKSSDQLATLANSFNSMTASIEKLIEEQKEKQRLENELAIAQEVQAQLFPKQISQLASLEVHGFCRPARTVSGDYYDFLTVDSDKLLLAVGDISGKGISAALLMATIHSAVRAYSLEGTPILREPVAVGAAAGSGLMLASGLHGGEVSPGTLLALLNHQLYESTPAEKYATLFLGIYDGHAHRLTYSNGGHLPPIVMTEEGTVRRLEAGGTVVGLFDGRHYEEGCIQLHRGEIFLAYSDGVTEPENDFGEFGEHRLIELVRENRALPLAKISEQVTAAVDDWIGPNEQPDDVTLVLARVR
ncbi:MAG: PP2C family protein-serine/threonine phosphatase [Acidobacteriia bacterium]|nr:PP2C family protein-serine/threonine phosphatase [Terriglobia bacterium]